MTKLYDDGSLVVYNKGKKTPKKTKQKISRSFLKFLATNAGKEFLQKIAKTQFQKGQIPHNKGKPMPEEKKEFWL